MNKHRYILTLPSGRTSDLVVQGMLNTMAAMKGSRWADVHLRKNGEWQTFEADWLRYMTVKRQPRILSLIDTVAAFIRRRRYSWPFYIAPQSGPQAAAETGPETEETA